MENFADWLNDQLEQRGWSRSEAARRGRVSTSMFDKVINGYAKPGPEFCTGVARAFKIPPERVFREAGLLPAIIIGREEDDELLDYFHHLNTDHRHTLLTLARALHDDQAEYQINTKGKQ